MERPTSTGPSPSGVALSFSKDSLLGLRQLNTYFLETLNEVSRHPSWRGSRWEAALGENLAGSIPSICGDLSQSPVSLVDIGLNDSEVRPLVEAVSHEDLPALPAFLPRDRALQLTQATLTLAWTLAQNDPVSASIVFAVPSTLVREIRALGLHLVPAISQKLSSRVRPRWLQKPRIWRYLLDPARLPHSERSAPLYVRVLQRQFADLSPATSAKRFYRDIQR